MLRGYSSLWHRSLYFAKQPKLSCPSSTVQQDQLVHQCAATFDLLRAKMSFQAVFHRNYASFVKTRKISAVPAFSRRALCVQAEAGTEATGR
jgi:hypothetical protein